MKLSKLAISSALFLGISGALPLTTTPVHAATNYDCTSINGLISNQPPSQNSSSLYRTATLNLQAGDKVTYLWQNNFSVDATPNLTIYNMDTSTSENTVQTTVSANGGTGQLVVTAQSSAEYQVSSYFSKNGASAADFRVTISCAQPTASNETSSETTSKAVTSAVSRSQTSVIQQNIGARVATVVGSAGAGVSSGGVGAPSGAGAGGTGTGGSTGGASGGVPGAGNDETASFADNRYGAVSRGGFAYRDSADDMRAVMRKLAMNAAFDSSVIAADLARDHALALGPTDEGSVGGAAGVDGRAALQSYSPITVWGHGSYTSVDNDFNSGGQDNRYDGDVWGYNIGADYRFENGLIAGASVGYNDTNLTTSFNNGSYDESAWVISPYAIYQPIANLSVVAEAGYSQGDIDVTRSNGSINGSTNSAMWYASLKTSYFYQPLADYPVSISPSVSFLAAQKTIDSYVESDNTFVESSRSNTRQVKPSLEAAYDFELHSLKLTPFVETGLIYDFTDELNNDKSAFNIGGGLRLSDATTGLNAALEASYLAGRTDYNEYTLAGTLSYGFELRDLTGASVGFMSPFFGSDVDEYGNQSMSTGFGFDTGPMSSRLSLAHDISQSGNAASVAQVNMTLAF
jgi:hypothetical protein